MKPILFNMEMVRAILDGRKTQTRRLRGLKDINKNPDDWRHVDVIETEEEVLYEFNRTKDYNTEQINCPYGNPGDKLWVRETWTKVRLQHNSCKDSIIFRADNCIYGGNPIKWKPSIYMPRKHARIFLEITNIRVERVQDITEKDAVDEGISLVHNAYGRDRYGVWGKNGYWSNESAKTIFQYLWNSINEKRGYGWEVNPWVWVIEFKKL